MRGEGHFGLASATVASSSDAKSSLMPRELTLHAQALLTAERFHLPRGYDPAVELEDTVIGFDDGGSTLVVNRRVEGCEVEGEGTYEVRITNFSDPAKVREHASHPIYDLAAVDTTLYLLDGGGLSRSLDRGASWQTTWPIPSRDPAVSGVPFALLAFSGDHTTIIVLTSENGPTRKRDGPADDIIGGSLFRSDDAGVTWRALPIPSELENPCSIAHTGACADGRGVEWMTAPTGQLDLLVIGGAGVGGANVAWTSRDGGMTWSRGTSRPSRRSRTARIGNETFEGTSDGLVTIHDHTRQTITPELTEPYRVDRF